MPTPTLTLEEVAELAHIDVATLRDWLNGPFHAPSEVQQLGPFTTLAICIAAELTRQNVQISKAVPAGMKFSHTNEGSPQRDYPGALYGRELGRTVLAIDISGEVRIVPAPIADSNAEILSKIFGHHGVSAINMNPLVERIERKINAEFGSLPRKQGSWFGE